MLMRPETAVQSSPSFFSWHHMVFSIHATAGSAEPRDSDGDCEDDGRGGERGQRAEVKVQGEMVPTAFRQSRRQPEERGRVER